MIEEEGDQKVLRAPDGYKFYITPSKSTGEFFWGLAQRKIPSFAPFVIIIIADSISVYHFCLTDALVLIQCDKLYFAVCL